MQRALISASAPAAPTCVVHAAAPSPARKAVAPGPARPPAADGPLLLAELQATLDNAGVALAFFHAEGGLRWANAEWAGLLGAAVPGDGDRSLAKVGAALRSQLRHPSSVPEDDWLAERLALTDEAQDAPLALADGRWLRLRLRPAPMGGVVLSAHDVTHDTEVDRQRSEFLSTAAHELRNPMASILGFAELLMTRTVSPAQTKELAGIIHRQSTWLVGMVNELLDLARIESRRGKDLRLAPLALQPWLDETLAAQGPQASRVLLKGADPGLRLFADAAKARQALANVLSNALKYSPQGGPVNLAAHSASHEGRAGVCIEVADQGIGMDPASVARIFERFYRADPSGDIPGTGLGMSLVQEIMALHRGDVQVRSQPGRGTTVQLWFPAAT